MHLSRISINGFKSFAEKCEIELKPGITTVVGPNGSGKSNIVDAIRWVLGEQSAKSLRGTNSSDVVFTGSKDRSGKTRATVALTFDNSDKYLNSDFSEIEVKRAIYLNGENEYYINGSRVRLKDITNLFIDKGASKESFNIISQGSITDVINSKPEERRVMFESAAGVLKYKKRKEETLRKLEKTKDNLERVDLLLTELETTITPLKEQAEIATKYLDFKKSLSDTEIALIVHDITNFTDSYSKTKDKITELTDKITNIRVSETGDSSKLEKEKLNIIKLDEKISKQNEKLLELTSEIAELNSKKQIMVERKKFDFDDLKVQSNMLQLKEDELQLKKNIKALETEIDLLKKSLSLKIENQNEKKSEIDILVTKRNTLNEKVMTANKNILETKQKISILENAIEGDSSLPFAVKSVLNNPKLSGVHSTIGRLLEFPVELSLALDVSLGYSANVVVVDNEGVAKNCISYLKENNGGRATFFPMNIIKPKWVEPDVLERIAQIDGFIGVLSDLVEYDSKYENIIKNQLGNVLCVKNIDALNLIGRITSYKYKIVSLTGEISHTGGALSGGSNKKTSAISGKVELDKLNKDIVAFEQTLKTVESQLSECQSEINILETNIYELNKDIIDITEQVNRKSISLDDLNGILTSKIEELKNSNKSGDALDKDVDKILEKYYTKASAKEVLEKQLDSLKQEKRDLTDKIQILENESRKINAEYNKLQNELKSAEIEYSKFDVKLDNLLQVLSENYSITYEKAKTMYLLDTPINEARTKVTTLKQEIKALGEVNTGSIAEYERLDKRYTFLNNQKSDINTSMTNLLTIISEMDEIMQDKFSKTFGEIRDEFAKTFRKLFKGGEGILKLTDPENILETGIEIIAMPPGKKLSSITLLSGGEKTLTAISLLFAIINIQPIPFCVLDEVEAALDEANVDTFGKYLVEKKDLSQFIIITHKKKTMEYADMLYGVTMQSSGVSKLVSVELQKT